MAEIDSTVASDSPGQEDPWPWWMLALFGFALLPVYTIASFKLVHMIQGANLDQDVAQGLHKCANNVVGLGVITLAFFESSLWLSIVAWCALVIGCTTLWTLLGGWLRGKGLAEGLCDGVTTFAVLGIVMLASTRWSLFVNIMVWFGRLWLCKTLLGDIVQGLRDVSRDATSLVGWIRGCLYSNRNVREE